MTMSMSGASSRNFFSRPVEPVTMNPDNPYIAGAQLVCAAAELPLTAGEPLLQSPEAEATLQRLTGGLHLLQSADGTTWFSPQLLPQRHVNLRGGGPSLAILELPKRVLLGTMDGGRVLLLLQEKGLIKLKPSAGLKATPLDVADNPKKLRFVELDAAQLPRSLDDLDAAAINTNYALPAGLSPSKDAIAIEGPKGPYANILVVRTADQKQPWVAKFVKAYRSPEVRAFIKDEFKGSVVADF